MHKRFARLVLAILAALGLVMVGLTPTAPQAGATGVSQADWIGGWSLNNTYSGEPCAGIGFFMYAQNNAHYYLVIPRSIAEGGVWGGTAGANPFCAVRDNDWSNYFDITQVIMPWGNSGGINYAKYDMALVDMGVAGSEQWAVTDATKNWCHPYPHCAGPKGGGWGAANLTTQGYTMNAVGNVSNGGFAGVLACATGPFAGTSCGNVSTAYHDIRNGYDQWVWLVPSMGNCGTHIRDRGSHVYYTEDANNLYTLGMHAVAFDPVNHVNQDECFINTGIANPSAATMGYIPWTSIAAGWPTLGLVPVA